MAKLETDPIALYRKNRASHFHACGEYRSRAGDAWRGAKYTARAHRLWSAAERAGLVRIGARDDSGGWSDFFDCDTYSPTANPDYPGGARALAAEKKAAEAHIESVGVVGIVGEYRTDPSDARGWQTGGAVWGMEGDTDPHEANGYGPDIMLETLGELRSALRDEARKRADLRADRCPHCHGTGRAK